MYPHQLPDSILNCADRMGATIIACAKAQDQIYLVARWRDEFVCWAWDGRGFSSGQYCSTEEQALARLRARLA